MQQEPILRMLCLRHGHTNYTGIFPDLTEQGLTQATRAANVDVAYWMRSNRISPDKVLVLSSPAPRAHGTAETIVKALRLKGEIIIDQDLAPMAWRDPERCKAALGGLAGRGYIDYETEPIFADSTLFETQAEMRNRSFTRFARRIHKATENSFCQYELSLSHYEGLCPYVAELFGIVASKETALQYVEPIELTVFEMRKDTYYVAGEFRGVRRNAAFSVKDLVFAPV